MKTIENKQFLCPENKFGKSLLHSRKFAPVSGNKWWKFPHVIQKYNKLANLAKPYSAIYNISRQNFAILQILRCSFEP